MSARRSRPPVAYARLDQAPPARWAILPMLPGDLRLALLCLAFWTAWLGWPRARFAAGLAVGAALCTVGWTGLHADRLPPGWSWRDAALGGSTILFLPLGVLACLPRRGGAWARARAHAFRALAPALGLAKLGCLVGGCCGGTPSALPWAIDAGAGRVHPTQAYEVIGFLALGVALRLGPLRFGTAGFLAGLGAIRLAAQPLRAPPPIGAPLVPIAGLAGAWLVAGGVAAWRARRRGRLWHPAIPALRLSTMLDQLSSKDRLKLMEFVCSFAWADLEIRPEERAFISRLVRGLELDQAEEIQVHQWLDVPPSPEDLDPTSIPHTHRRLFIDAAEGVIAADGQISPEEREHLELFKALVG